MSDSTIPWHLFLDALKQQNPATIDIWLGRWLFTDAGVVIAQAKPAGARPIATAVGKQPHSPPVTGQRKQAEQAF